MPLSEVTSVAVRVAVLEIVHVEVVELSWKSKTTFPLDFAVFVFFFAAGGRVSFLIGFCLAIPGVFFDFSR